MSQSAPATTATAARPARPGAGGVRRWRSPHRTGPGPSRRPAGQAGRPYAGMAASSSRSAAGTGCCWQAASMDPVRTWSHWQAAFSARRCSVRAGAPGIRVRATSAPRRAIGRANAAISVSRARFIGSLVMVSAHQDRWARPPFGPGMKWVCSRSRPAARAVATSSRCRARGLADGAGGHNGLPMPGRSKYPAALVRACRAWARACPHGPPGAGAGARRGTSLNAVAVS
jgi:hypothetical protein